MKIIGVIPARYASSRFPGKPLADIHGKPMIWWVYRQAASVPELDDVIVATDSEKIKSACDDLGLKSIMTLDKHPTGTDRVAEVALKIPADIYVNVQGDEPLIEPGVILSVIKPLLESGDIQVSNLMSRITDPVDAINPTVPKVIASSQGRGVYLTRSMAPFPKAKIDYAFFKQVCAYAFTPWALEFFRKTPRGYVESIEDIEILRFIENGVYVKFIEVSSESVAVDTDKDLEKVRAIVAERQLML